MRIKELKLTEHADSLDIDPKRVVAYGWSAGGHLAASAAIFGLDASGDSVSARPDALVLVSPAVSLVADGWGLRLLRGRGTARDISPDEHVRKGLPPTLVLQGNVDTVTPMAGAKRFCERMRAAGSVCELQVYKGVGHLFTPAGTPDDGMPQPDQATSEDASKRANRFLESLGFLKGTVVGVYVPFHVAAEQPVAADGPLRGAPLNGDVALRPGSGLLAFLLFRQGPEHVSQPPA